MKSILTLKRAFQLLSLSLSIFCLDYVVKALTSFYIQPITYAYPVYPFGGIAIFHNFLGIDFCLNHVANKGAAWGILSSMQEGLLGLRILVVGALIGYVVFSAKSRPHAFPLTLVITGALGNIVDYFVYGHVIDMFHFIFWGYSYPVFNIADISIFCGIAWMMVQSLAVKNVEIKREHSGS